jgi:carboxyl-terminal processing protease
MGKRLRKSGLAILSFLLLMGLLIPSAVAGAPEAAALRSGLDRGIHLERLGLWQQAADVYEKLIHDGLPHVGSALRKLKDHYQLCLRHIYQARRLQDHSFRREVLSKDLDLALKVYSEVLVKIRTNYIDRDKTDLSRLFRQGVEELRMALADPLFVHQHLATVKPDVRRAFELWVAGNWQDRVIHSRPEAVAEVKVIALAAQRRLGLRPTCVVLEFACGACNSLDEYSVYLTPSQLREIYESLRGEEVGIGISVVVDHQKMLVAQVLAGGPAAQAMPPVHEHDQILRIDHKSVENLTADAVDERLRGAAGTTVQLDVLTFGDSRPHSVVLTRQLVPVPSVLSVRIIDDDLKVGYFQLTGFQETTLDEVDRALALLKAQGMKALVLDLRGNPGGLVPVAIHVAERFLSEGVIVTTQNRLKEQNRKYEANNLTALAVPLVVLVDSDTASAAEILAGALKDNHRARLVGQTTYGKGCIQGILKLDTVPAGLRITLARFLSPRGHRYSDCGVVPDLLVDRNVESNYDEQFHAALDLARQLAVVYP